MGYTWSEDRPEARVRRIAPDRPVYFISDLHLGDGGASDIFMGKDRTLLDLLAQVREEGARLVICGDAIDFHQAWNLTRVLRAHGKLLRAISDLADSNGVIYIYGNHDHDIALFHDVFRWEVASELWIGPDIVIQHGHEFDPFIGPNLQSSHLATRVHHLVERVFGTWIRLPLADFYTPGNRFTFWCFHKLWLAAKVRNRAFRAVGFRAAAEKSERFARYWVRSEAGDPMSMLAPTLASARARNATTVVCGHAHMPCNFETDGVRYVNTGSWTYGWSQYARVDGASWFVGDWLSKREYGGELYRAAMEGELDHIDFDRWWRNQYLGWFRFRSGESRRTAA